MICPQCGRENQPSSRFCIYCGAFLSGQEADESFGRSQDIREEIRRLRNLLAQVTNRLDALERDQGAFEPSPEPGPVAPGPVPVQTPAEPVITGPETGAAPFPEQAVAPPAEKPPRAKEREWEQILGGSWLARIGVLALIIGVGFFLKYAFDNDWLGPTGRVILGGIAGLLMLGAGYRWKQRYPIMTRVLSGGGIAVLYLSIFASSGIYDLINFYAALALLFLLSIISAFLALRHDSMSLAILGIIGAFLAPFILGAFRESVLDTGGSDQAIQLIAYIIVVDLGVLALATFRNWRWFTLLALFCSLASFGAWYAEFEREISTVTAEVAITLIFIIFIGVTTLFHILWRHIAPRAADFGLMAVNAAAYFGISLGLMWDDYRGWVGLHVFLTAALYGLISYLAYRRQADSPALSRSAMGIALIFLTVAIPLQLGDKAWVTVVWSVEGLVLMWLAFRTQITVFRYCGIFVFMAVVVRLLFFDTSVEIETFRIILNERFLAFVVGIASMYATVYLTLRARRGTGERVTDVIIFLLITNFLTIWILSFEVWDYFSHAMIGVFGPDREGLSDAQNLALTGVWAIYAVILLVIGIWRRWRYVRLGALAFLAVPVVKVFVYDVFQLELGYRIGAFVGLGVLLLVAAYLYQRYSKVIRGVFTDQ